PDICERRDSLVTLVWRRHPGEQTRVTSESRRSQMSGAPSYSSQPYPYKNIHGYLRQIFEAFGPERLFWGTDITRMPCNAGRMFTEELPWLKGRDLERVMGGAVVDWLGWKRPA